MRHLLLLVIASLVLCCSVLLTSCGSNSHKLDDNRTVAPQTQLPGGFNLPDFSLGDYLADLKPVVRNASYEEVDLITHGDDYTNSLPWQNVSPAGMSAEFAAAWLGNGLAGAAYCMYEFEMPGYDREPEINYGWESPPNEIQDAYIGLANWGNKRWNWFQCSESGTLVLPAIDDYISGAGGRLLAAIVVIGSGNSRLRYLRIGPTQLEAKLSASPSKGILPFTTQFDGSNSSSAPGPVMLYEWDFNGDGVFDEQGSSDTTSHVYDSFGTAEAIMRVTNEFSESDTDSLFVTGYYPWEFTWGGNRHEQLNSVDAPGDGNIYASGFSASFHDGDNNEDVLLMRSGPIRGSNWMRSWNGPDYDDAKAIAVDPNGDIYIAGVTGSFGAGGSDVLIQRWSKSGDLVWCRVWGGSSGDSAWGIELRGDYLFIGGSTSSFGAGEYDALLLKYDLDGNFIWARTAGASGKDQVWAMTSRHLPFSQTSQFYLAGDSDSFSANNDSFYVSFNSDGELLSFKTWPHAQSSATRGIGAGGGFSGGIYVCGFNVDTGTVEAFLIEVTTGDPLAKYWNTGSSATRFTDVRVAGDELYVAGFAGGHGDTGDVILMTLTQEGSLENLRAFGIGSGDEERGVGMDLFPQTGAVVVGAGQANDGMHWEPISAALGDLPGSWVSQTVTVNTPAGIQGSPVGDVRILTTGVYDEGGGWEDALVTVTTTQ